MSGDNSLTHGNRGHSTSSRSGRLKARNKKKFFESASEMSPSEPLAVSAQRNSQGTAQTMKRKNSPRKSNEGGESGRNTTTKSNKEGSTNMFRSRRTLANNTWTSSAVGFTRSAEKQTVAESDEKKYEDTSQGQFKNYAPILVLEMQENNEYEYKD